MTDADPPAEPADEESGERTSAADDELSPGATLDDEHVAEPNEPA